MKPEQLHKLADYFYSASRTNEQYLLRLSPLEAVRDAAKELNLKWTDQELDFIAAVLIEQGQIATSQSVTQKQRAKDRIDKAIRAIRHAFRLTLVMHNVMFYLGTALIIIGVVSGFNGRTTAGIIIGGIGLVDLIFFLIKEPIEGIHESVGNLMQLRAAYNSYFVQLDQWQLYYDYQADEKSFPVKQQVSNQIHQYTEATLNLIQQYCKPSLTNRMKRVEEESNGT